MQQIIKIVIFASLLAMPPSLARADAKSFKPPFKSSAIVVPIGPETSDIAAIPFADFSRKLSPKLIDNGRFDSNFVSFSDRLQKLNVDDFDLIDFLSSPGSLINRANGSLTKAQVSNVLWRSAKTANSPRYPRPRTAVFERVRFFRPSLAPMAFIRFCGRYPKDCQVHETANAPDTMTLTDSRWRELVRVNRVVNKAIKPKANRSGVMAEEWLIFPRSGDCNDYAVTKRHLLLATGWSSHSLSLAEVVIPSGEHHLVLIVRTRENDLVLDNLDPRIRTVAHTPYQWIRAQSTSNPTFWSIIGLNVGTRTAMVDH